MSEWQLRTATLDDRPAIQSLIERSSRALCVGEYDTKVVEAALQGAFGVDSELIRDGTYFVVETGDKIVGCGGWSMRATKFGGDAHGDRDSSKLNPTTDAAKIRAFFVDPAHTRKGIAAGILDHCEAKAQEHGFQRLELTATLPGVPFYRARGYIAGQPEHHEIAPGVSIEFLPMRREIDSNASASASRPRKP